MINFPVGNHGLPNFERLVPTQIFDLVHFHAIDLDQDPVQARRDLARDKKGNARGLGKTHLRHGVFDMVQLFAPILRLEAHINDGARGRKLYVTVAVTKHDLVLDPVALERLVV